MIDVCYFLLGCKLTLKTFMSALYGFAGPGSHSSRSWVLLVMCVAVFLIGEHISSYVVLVVANDS